MQSSASREKIKLADAELESEASHFTIIDLCTSNESLNSWLMS